MHMVIPVRGSMAQGGDGLYKPPAPPDMLPPSFHVEDYIHSPSTTLLYKFEDCLNTFNQYNGSSVNEANSPGTHTLDSDSEADIYEADSAYGSEINDFETVTVIKSEHIFHENGRTYPTLGNYWGPNDETAEELQGFSHETWIELLGGRLFTPPLGESPQAILDIGAGTGACWCFDIADMFPSAHVKGIDISVMPRDVPVNASFEMVDINSPGYQELPSHYDMVHVRELRGSMRAGEVLVGKWYQALKPGGWLVLADIDMHFKAPEMYEGIPVLDTWVETLIEAGNKRRMRFDICPMFEGWMKSAGFTHVEVEIINVPVGGPTKLGKYNKALLLGGLFDISARPLSKVFKWSLESIIVFNAEVRAALGGDEARVGRDFYIVQGQRPLES